MTDTPASASADHPAELELGGWRIQPSLNRLSRDGVAVRLEPKVMDVLLLLARSAGQVVSKDEIADAVWPQAYLSESVITRAIAELRRALEDDVRAPRFIETIAKRGYRLLLPALPVEARSPFAEVLPETALPSARFSAAPERLSAHTSPSSSPHGLGQWVRGERFYGRSAEIAEILGGPRNGIWVLGTRAVGKTSLLKQLEHLTAHDPAERYFPLFWDLQGSVDPQTLSADFHAALAEVEDRLNAIDLGLAEIQTDDLFATLGRLRRALRSRGLTLLLLWDEVEELLHLQAADPTILRKLRRALQSQEGIRTVMASGPRLWRLAEQRDDTSPFLHGFSPPLYLGPLEEEAARRLARQTATAVGAIDEVLRRSGGHPSVLQLLCARLRDLGDLERATDSVAADPTVRFFFAVDFDLLTPLEREVLLSVAEGAGTTDASEVVVEEKGVPPGEIFAAQMQLQRLGILRAKDGGRLEVASSLFRSWLREQPPAVAPWAPSRRD